MAHTTRLLFVAGAARAGSYNKRLARLGAEIANANGIHSAFADLGDYPDDAFDYVILSQTLQAMGVPREVLRQKGTPYDELGLGDPKWTDAQLIDFMLQHPILINRPIVVTPLATRLCRPSELVLDILPRPQQGAFAKEDGEAVIDAKGQRVGKS